MRAFLSCLVGTLLLGAACLAQDAPPIIAKHYEPPKPSPEEIASPMLLEVSMGTTAKRTSVQDMDSRHAWVATETAGYVCKSVRVRFIQVWKAEHGGKVNLRVIPVLNDHPEVDVTVTVSIISDSKEIKAGDLPSRGLAPLAERILSPVTALGSGASPATDFEFTKEEFAALFGPGRAPSVRVVVKIEE
jgi:hypothetical protein